MADQRGTREPSEPELDDEDEGDDESLEGLKAKAKALKIPGSDRMSREDLLYQILKHQGGDGGLSI